MKVEYVCGFVIDPATRMVLLVRNPSNNKLDGVRGQVMPGETPAEAMTSTLSSITGLLHSVWSELAVMESEGYRTYYMQASRYNLFGTRGDAVVVPLCDTWRWPVVPNLRWLLGMTMDDKLRTPVRFQEKNDAVA